MKTLLPGILEGMVGLFGALSTGRETFFSSGSFINEDFFDQFRTEEDKKLLNKTVADLKMGNEKSREIKLSNHQKVTIVVD